MLTLLTGAVAGVAAFAGGWYARDKYSVQAEADLKRLHDAISRLEATVKTTLAKAKGKL